MNEQLPGDGRTPPRLVMAILALLLLIFGAMLYQQFVGFLCFDYCGTAEDYATHSLVSGAYLIGPGAVAMLISFALLLRSLWRTGHTRVLGLAAAGMFALLVAAGLYLWSGAPWIGQTGGSVSPSVFDPVTRATPERVIHVAIAVGVVSLLLAWPVGVSRAPLRRISMHDEEAM